MAKRDCQRCGGTGWVVAKKEEISAAERCACVAEARADELEQRAQIPQTYRDSSFDNFLKPQDNPIAQKALSDVMWAVKSYVRGYPTNPKPGLLLAGPAGTGKTHLAVAALRELIARGHEGIFFDYQNLLDCIRSGYDEALGTSKREAYRAALDTEILLLDDLGAHRATNWVEDTVTAIVTHRYNHRKPLIATTNLADPDMGTALFEKSAHFAAHTALPSLQEQIGERARSRLFEMCLVVRMPAVPDYRIKQSVLR